MSSAETNTPVVQARPPSARWFLVAFTLLGSYCLSANAAIALHECGHALGGWLAGGKMIGLVLAPQGYSGSYADRDESVGFALANGYLLLIAGGVAFGTAFGLILLVAACCFTRGSVAWIALHGTGTWCVGNNGAYLFFGSLFPFDDAWVLIELGVSWWILLVAGLPLVVSFLVLFASFLRGIGLEARDSLATWVLTVAGGLMGYIAAIVGWRLVQPPDGDLPSGPMVVLSLALSPVGVILLATCTYPFRRLTRWHESPTLAPSWPKAGVVFALGVLFLAIEVMFFHAP